MTPTQAIQSFAMRSRGPSSFDPWFKANGQADVEHYFGAACEELFIPGEPASGGITGKINSNVLSPVTSPLYQQTFTGQPGDPKGAGFDNGTTDSFDAANNTVFDETTGSFCWFYVWKYAGMGGNNRTMLGKLDATPRGWWILATVGGTANYFQVFGDSGNKTLGQTGLTPDANVHYFVVGRRAGTDVIMYSDVFGDKTVADTALGSLTSTGTFAIGSVRTSTAAGHVDGTAIYWKDANADTVLSDRATIFPAWATEAGI